MQVDLNKLKTFYILAGTKSYTRCGDKMCLTQSAVSHAIKKLETDLGFDLVDRQVRQFRLTREGEFLYRRCAGIFNRIEDTLDGLVAGKELPVSINLGAPVEFGSSVLIKGMTPFFLDHPHIHIDFMLAPQLLDPLLMDELDIIVDCVPHVHDDLVSIPLLREEYAVIASPAYVREKNIGAVPDLKLCNLLSFDRELTWWKNFINGLEEASDFGFEKITRISNVRGIINAALESLGVGFVPRYTVLKELEKGLLLELFPETGVLNDQINIYLKKRNFEKQVFKDLINHIKSLKLN
ncbi:LysR family transcriptional regulator [Desulfospira joergensenii]|uniref:LysR family transcriptional regulator n=1 Tax=Desulfospira joergensenii TaxID=53329 RepID=UPI00040E89EC|nr:LysR family transcriptional regulator [Desulfospira joergensenii]